MKSGNAGKVNYVGGAKNKPGYVGYAARIAAMDDEQRDAIRAMISADSARTRRKVDWKLLAATPPGSALQGVLAAFEQETDIPLELPFFGFISYISAYLLAKHTKITGSIGTIYPDIWTLLLADSGSGKTWAVETIGKAAPALNIFPECNSGAKFLEAFQTANFGLWLQDEIAQKLKQIEQPGSPLCEVKEYLLRAYSNSPIERSTLKHGTVRIEEPCLSILGMNTQDSFFKSLSAESLTDGFAQRFAFVMVEKDEKRPMIDYALYDRAALIEASELAFKRIVAVQVHPVYTITRACEIAYTEAFRQNFRPGIPPSFYRRTMFRAFRYALLYHILLEKESAELDQVDMLWGVRLACAHLEDMGKVLGRSDLAGVDNLVKKAKRAQDNITARGGKPTARAIRQSVREIESSIEAEAVLSLVSAIEEPDAWAEIDAAAASNAFWAECAREDEAPRAEFTMDPA